MRYRIQPVMKRLGINERVSRHTFRSTYMSLLASLLAEKLENVKVVRSCCGTTR